MSWAERIERAWYGRRNVLWPLTPLEMLYRFIVQRRRARFLASPPPPLGVPVIVVGNLSVGGTGKSPLVAWLVDFLQQQGGRPGIVSRGYGGSSPDYPLAVMPDSDPAVAGDEPVMLAQSTGVPVAVSPVRSAGIRQLQAAGCDVVISDDGLQHYGMARDIELVVVDGTRGFGNRHCLPCGPLREPMTRLASVDAVIGNGASSVTEGAYEMHLEPLALRNLVTNERLPPRAFAGQSAVHAVAGIGHPARFFRTLSSLGIDHEAHPFPDHHRFTADDLVFDDDAPVIMTAKDAVKCRNFADARCWALDVRAQPSQAFVQFLQTRLNVLASREGRDRGQ